MKISGSEIIEILTRHDLFASSDDGFEDLDFTGISYNSSSASNGDLFFCKGKLFREEYLDDASKKGAVAFVSESKRNSQIPGIYVKDVYKSLAIISDAFNNYPQKDLCMFGVTGTNGKTSIVYYVQTILNGQNKKCAYISTLGGWNTKEHKEFHLTTPEASDTHSFMRESLSCGAEYFAMECSSMGEKKDRLYGISYDFGIITNISDDHYSPFEHSSFEEYFEYKRRIVRRFKKLIINADDENCMKLLSVIEKPEKIIKYSLNKSEEADIYAENISYEGFGMNFTVVTPKWKRKVHIRIPGLYNVSNVLAVFAFVYMADLNPELAAKCVGDTVVPGRMNLIEKNGYTVVVDFAHNKSGLFEVLKTLKYIYPDKPIKTVFGITGDNGIQRRKDLVSAAANFSDFLYITEDDSLTSDINIALKETAEYAKLSGREYIVIEDRKTCIEYAIEKLNKDELLVIASKGNEKFLKKNGKCLSYEGDDVIVENSLKAKK